MALHFLRTAGNFFWPHKLKKMQKSRSGSPTQIAVRMVLLVSARGRQKTVLRNLAVIQFL